MTTRYAVRAPELTQLLSDLGEPRYRVDQVLAGLYEQRRPL
jgi:hypothetical protein